VLTGGRVKVRNVPQIETVNESPKERIADKDKNLEDLPAITKLIEH
jgi:hypothetical protein